MKKLLLLFWMISIFAIFTMPAECEKLWVDPAAPASMIEKLNWDGAETLFRGIHHTCEWQMQTENGEVGEDNFIKWVYMLVAPYSEVKDGITLGELKSFWKYGVSVSFNQLAVTAQTRQILIRIFGAVSPNAEIKELESDQILKFSWENKGTWAIIPFEDADPRWKVIEIDGMSPFTYGFVPDSYILTTSWKMTSVDNKYNCGKGISEGNFDPEKLTTLTLTGTTAITRQLAYHIETDGIDYPIVNIKNTIARSDITHISNEVSFTPDCPPAVPLRRDGRFCSAPSYFSILQALGTDIVELTGNHNLDWGTDPYLYSLNLYDKAEIQYYGGGLTEDAAQKPVFIENHGNKIAFLGCNSMGPDTAWAGNDKPGAAKCDLEKMKKQVTELKAEGWLPVVTFQNFEYSYYDVPPVESHDFYAVAEAGPVIISGSQAHIPQGMTFVNQTFIHFGLGNLLFDQMSDVEKNSFFDRHYFYENRYIGNILETIQLENYSQTRFLTGSERSDFLNLIFSTNSWDKTFPNSKNNE